MTFYIGTTQAKASDFSWNTTKISLSGIILKNVINVVFKNLLYWYASQSILITNIRSGGINIDLEVTYFNGERSEYAILISTSRVRCSNPKGQFLSLYLRLSNSSLSSDSTYVTWRLFNKQLLWLNGCNNQTDCIIKLLRLNQVKLKINGQSEDEDVEEKSCFQTVNYHCNLCLTTS